MSAVKAASPSGSSLLYKGRSLGLVCRLEDRGRPVTRNFAWFKVGAEKWLGDN